RGTLTRTLKTGSTTGSPANGVSLFIRDVYDCIIEGCLNMHHTAGDVLTGFFANLCSRCGAAFFLLCHDLYLTLISSSRQQFYVGPCGYVHLYGCADRVPEDHDDDEVHGSNQYPSDACCLNRPHDADRLQP